MKAFMGMILLAAVAFAEPPTYRQRYQPQRQYYFAKQEEAAEGPYPPSSWRPNGPAFELPQKVQNVPQRQYGPPVAAPQQQYGAPVAAPQQKYGFPEQKYGAPESTTEIPNDTTEIEESTTLSSDSESVPVKRVNELADEDLDESQPKESGEYYIALPDGRLQRVQYVSSQNVEAMKYFAKIRAENVEPLRGPIYAYAPLPKLQILPGGLQLSVAPGTPVTAAAVASVTVEESKPERILGSASPAKLEIQPVTQVQYQYDNPAAVVPLSKSAPLSSSYTTYTANYQVPAGEARYILAI